MGGVRVLFGVVALLLVFAASANAQIKAGVAVVDATYNVGSSAGQYASSADPTSAEPDPFAQQVKNAPSYGVQSRLTNRALVIERGGQKMAIVKSDLYLSQDLLTRRVAQLLEAENIGIGRGNLVVSVTHDHSSPYYTSSAFGAWTFQDVLDIRAFNYHARQLARAVKEANAKLVPVRVGAAQTQFDKTNRSALGPAVADDGTPAGYPDSYTDRDMTLLRFDDISNPSAPKPLANLVNFSLHPESLNGNDLISADYIAPIERLLDRDTGAVTVWTQNAVGGSEPEDSKFHPVAERLSFVHKEYGQAEYGGRLMADALVGLHREVGTGGGKVPFFTDGELKVSDRWFPGPLTHPFPTVSNCRTAGALDSNPELPVVGLPDCAGPKSAFEEVGFGSPAPTAQNPGPGVQELKEAGIPVPDQYGAIGYGGLEEDVSIHLTAFRLGEILFTVCPCEQWADQSANIETRTDRIVGNEFVGYDWSKQCTDLGASFDCPNPRQQCALPGDAFSNTCRDPMRSNGRLIVPRDRYERMKAQVNNPANGWNSAAFAPYAESEPVDVQAIKGNYTQDDADPRSAQLGYRLTVPISMANDYTGYIPTYREYQRGDHYRKALAGWGPHSSDYMATRLVKMGRQLNGGPPVDKLLNGEPDPDADNPVLEAKTQEDLANNEVRARALGEGGTQMTDQYERSLPDDGGTPGAITQPADTQRFDAVQFSWRGGSNYTDNPVVTLERLDRGQWRPFAEQGGEIVTTVRYPSQGDRPAFLTGDQEWRWTANYEPFVAPFGLEAGRPRATPPGTYRFVARGRQRKGANGKTNAEGTKAYIVTSEPVALGPWTGITAQDVRREPDGTVSFVAGPSRVVDVPGGNPARATLGPIDYPDTWAGKPGAPRFVKDKRSIVRDPGAPSDPSRFEWYCLTCAFRPWLDTGQAETATVTFTAAKGSSSRVPATLRDGRWYTTRRLRSGEAAYVCPSDLRDAHGNFNGEISGTAGAQTVTIDCRDVEIVGVPNGAGINGATGSAANRGLGDAGRLDGRGETGSRSALGLPASGRRRCVSRRNFPIRLRTPRKGLRIRSATVSVNGKRVRTLRGKRVRAKLNLRGLPKGRVVVSVRIKASDGRTYVAKRVYRTCVPKRQSAKRKPARRG